MRLATRSLSILALAGAALGCTQVPPAASPVDGGLLHRPMHGQILVTMRRASWASLADELQADYGLETVASWPVEALDVQCVLYQVAGTRPAAAVLRGLQTHPRVESAQLNQVFTLLDDRQEASPEAGDPYARLQYAPRRLGLAAAHEWSTGEGVDVAVIDTGMDVTHPELLGRVTVARNFVRQEQDLFTGDVHGTAMAGVIAAATGNGRGIVGTAPAARLRALKACWHRDGHSRQAVCTTYSLAQALDYSLSVPVDIVNLSLGGPRDPLLESLVRAALERGILVVAAASGEGDTFPTAVDGVLGVEACDAEGELWNDHGRPARAAGLVAPGVEILTLAPQASYEFLSGHSLAAAHVTGIAALVLARRPGMAPAEVGRLLAGTATRGETGEAIVNACRALASVLGRSCPSPTGSDREISSRSRASDHTALQARR